MSFDLETLNPLYRDIFSDSINGSPDNITKAGCVALARRGSTAWNAWRKDFPTKGGRVNHGYWVKSGYSNFTNFQNHIFEQIVDFSNFDFGPNAVFENTEFKKTVQFNKSIFGESANFELAKFQANAFFHKTRFEDGASFVCSQFKSGAFFQCAQLGGKTDFTGARFIGQTNFDKVLFGQSLIFDHAFFDYHLTTFVAGSWEDFASAYLTDEIDGIKQWAEKQNLQPGKMINASFQGANFKGTADFSGVEFSRCTRFTKSTCKQLRCWPERNDVGGLIPASNGKVQTLASFESTEGNPLVFGSPPIFHNCTFNQDVSFDGAEFPKATGFEGSIRAYRTLKLAFSQQQAIREEQRFFQLEIAEETKHADWPHRGWYEAYRIFSNYGFGLWQPLAVLFFAWLLFGLSYGWLANLAPCLPGQAGCSMSSEWLEFSLLQALPLPGLDKPTEALRLKLFDQHVSTLAVTVAVLFHKAISLLALFFTGLALRNLFKMK